MTAARSGTIKIPPPSEHQQDFTLTARPAVRWSLPRIRNAASNQQGVTRADCSGQRVRFLPTALRSGQRDRNQGVYPTSNGIEVRFTVMRLVPVGEEPSGVQEVEVQVRSRCRRYRLGGHPVDQRDLVDRFERRRQALDPGIFETNSSAVPFATATRPDGTQVTLQPGTPRRARPRFFVTGAGMPPRCSAPSAGGVGQTS